MTESIKRVTPNRLLALRAAGTKIAMMTAYDYPTGALLDRAGIDVLLVGDSLGTVIQGRETTLSVTLDAMIYHTEMVARAARRAMVIADLPFPFAQLGAEEAVRASARILKETGATGVKVEGGEKRVPVIQALIEAGIPVMGHCGLMPQEIRRLGGYKVQRDAAALQRDVAAVAAAGVMGVVLECVPREIAVEVTAASPVPTIGIGAGAGCDGQVLVFHDLLGFSAPESKTPKHARRYAELGRTVLDAVARYADDVRSGRFPTDDESFGV